MLDDIGCNDLYNVKTGDYVFLYNEAGSIAVYNLSNQTAENIARSAEGEYWGAYLGPGGTIYDDPSYESYSPEWSTSNLAWCDEHFAEEGWMTYSQFLEECMQKDRSPRRSFVRKKSYSLVFINFLKSIYAPLNSS
ncbi:MAG: hypothetical protein K6F86_07540 [Lachnospiraceae bacterium]|nr:hypothetical protein [Lachnospiraceae bacterium]